MKNTTFNIQFLGTSACDFSPKLENEFKDKFDMDARRSSAVLLNGKYLIDSGVHILDSLRIAGADRETITDIFLTHIHGDHFDILNVKELAKFKKSPLRIWLREDTRLPQIENTEYIKMTPYTKYEVEKGLFITGVNANHDEAAFPQHLIIEKDGKKMFYGCDGGWMLTKTYDFLKNADLDLMVLDCTIGDYVGDYRIFEHNSISTLRLMLPTFKNENIITEKTKVIFSHIAPSLHKPHNELVDIARELSCEVAYDGKIMEI